MEIGQVRGNTPGLLYPMMIIAAIAVIVFSIVGIASITGWMPNAMIGQRTAVATVEGEATPAFQCAECGLIQSVREIEQRGSLSSTPVAAYGERAKPATAGL
jgi:outer membrane lipoprotein SlyB